MFVTPANKSNLSQLRNNRQSSRTAHLGHRRRVITVVQKHQILNNELDSPLDASYDVLDAQHPILIDVLPRLTHFMFL